MAKLILSIDGRCSRSIPLTKERTTIGRKPHNDIVIDNLAVSGEHAVIVTILNDSFLEDLGSTNGTCVNGQPIKKHFLQNNDVIEIGKYKLKYLNDPPTQTSAADFEKTMVLRAPVKAAPPPAAKPAADLGDTQTNIKAPAAAEAPKRRLAAASAPAARGRSHPAPRAGARRAAASSSARLPRMRRNLLPLPERRWRASRDPGAFGRRGRPHARSDQEPRRRSASPDCRWR